MRFCRRNEGHLIDRFIKLLFLCLGGLLIFLVGHLLTGEGGDAGRSAIAPTSQVGQEPGTDAGSTDLATKRVKTVPVRP